MIKGVLYSNVQDWKINQDTTSSFHGIISSVVRTDIQKNNEEDDEDGNLKYAVKRKDPNGLRDT